MTDKRPRLATGVTIDAAHAVDLDDAIWVERTGDRQWRVRVAIADVPRLVRAGSDMDTVAYEQGVTIYLPGERSTPMLPREVERAASLLPGQRRHALLIEFTVDAGSGDRSHLLTEMTISRGEFRSAARFSHPEAAHAANNPDGKHSRMLAEALACATALLGARRRFGGLAVFDANAGWVTGEDGLPIRVGNRANVGYLIVQEMMIAANAAVAATAATAGLPILYRNHRANAAAPAAASFTADFDLAGASDGTVDRDSIIERIGLVAGRAVYEPVVGGHWALNLPAYTHATSPIRRYADVVTWRVLLAHLGLSDEPAPDQSQVADQASHLNALTVNAQNRKRDAFKSRWEDHATRTMSVQGLTRIGSAEFHTLLKATLSEGKPDQAFIAEVVRRSAAGVLPPKDLWLVAAAGLGWEDAKDAVIAYLAHHRHHAVSVLNIAEQTAGWLYKITPATRTEADLFRAEATVTRPGAPSPFVGDAQSSSVKTAEQGAALVAFAAAVGASLAGIADPAPEAKPVQSIQTEGRPAKQVLYELCQAQRWQPPSFATKRNPGPDHSPTFTSTVTVQPTNGEAVVSTSEPCPTKQDAEHDAAGRAVARVIAALPAVAADTPSIVVAKSGNFKGALHEWAQANHGAVQFDTQPTRTGFASTVTVIRSGEPVVEHGQGASKKDAEHAAAKAALANLN